MVPEEISAWKPDTAPQAMVINRNGNRLPVHTGPVPSTNLVSAGMVSVGRIIKMPTARPTIVPIFRKVER
ncbi:Uncharacterised protein [Shigella sonnei]|nr:Uncharacterised protein [Shigella sonnei]